MVKYNLVFDTIGGLFMKNRFKTAFLAGCGVFTAIITVMALVVASVEEKGQVLGLTPKKILMFFFFSAVVGAASFLISGKKTGVIKYILHFVLTFTAFFFLVMKGNGVTVKNIFFLLLIAGYILVYTACMIIRYFMRRADSKASTSDETSPENYTSIFKKD